MRIESQTLAKPNSPKYRRVLLEVQRQVQIHANHVKLVMNSQAQYSTNCSWKYSWCWIQVLKLWRQEVWSIWWAEAHKQLWRLLWQATNYVNHKHILCVLHWKIWCWTVCSVDLQDFFIWSDPHATDAIFLQGFFAMTVPKEMMIIIYVMNMMIMMNKVIPTMIKILHLALAIAFALYLMLQLALGWNEKKWKWWKIQWWQSWGGAGWMKFQFFLWIS